MTEQRTGIIDIGSNSIRLVIYEKTDTGAHRVIDGSKRSARLSGQMDEAGRLPQASIHELINTIRHFTRICSYHNTVQIRAIATAAIRNAENQTEILEQINNEIGLNVELLSGDEEASYGFLGMINSLSIQDGFLVDIGGGSTELSLFRNRMLIHSVSFPFGCVSLNKQFPSKEQLGDEELHSLEAVVKDALKGQTWIQSSPGLPLVGLGGTARALGKIHQSDRMYPFTQIHNYSINREHVSELFNRMRRLPFDKRRKLPGLSKDRVDVILPGIAILRTLFEAVKANHYLICGAGLRDGLFHETHFPKQPKLNDPLAYSLGNIRSLHLEVPRQHVMQVNRVALELLQSLMESFTLPPEAHVLMDTASQLFRIGASIDYYEYARHSFYLIVNSHLNGLSHREIIMVAAIASYRSKSRARQHIVEYKELLTDNDLELIYKLGVLLQLSAALDRSETQAIEQINIRITKSHLIIRPIQAIGSLAVERREVDELSTEFKKQWELKPLLESFVVLH